MFTVCVCSMDVSTSSPYYPVQTALDNNPAWETIDLHVWSIAKGKKESNLAFHYPSVILLCPWDRVFRVYPLIFIYRIQGFYRKSTRKRPNSNGEIWTVKSEYRDQATTCFSSFILSRSTQETKAKYTDLHFRRRGKKKLCSCMTGSGNLKNSRCSYTCHSLDLVFRRK
jgi:hypothetical protein